MAKNYNQNNENYSKQETVSGMIPLRTHPKTVTEIVLRTIILRIHLRKIQQRIVTDSQRMFGDAAAEKYRCGIFMW